MRYYRIRFSLDIPDDVFFTSERLIGLGDSQRAAWRVKAQVPTARELDVVESDPPIDERLIKAFSRLREADRNSSRDAKKLLAEILEVCQECGESDYEAHTKNCSLGRQT